MTLKMLMLSAIRNFCMLYWRIDMNNIYVSFNIAVLIDNTAS